MHRFLIKTFCIELLLVILFFLFLNLMYGVYYCVKMTACGIMNQKYLVLLEDVLRTIILCNEFVLNII
jgi:uncharacterized membrane protein